jgi:hypothetical protein
MDMNHSKQTHPHLWQIIPPFHACYSKAGVSNVSYSISLEPGAYGSIAFAITSSEDADHELNIVQEKKTHSLFSWYHQAASPTTTHWFDLDNTSCQAWHTLPSAPNLGALLPPPYIPSSAICDFHKSAKCTVSDYNVFKEDHLWHHL